MTCVLIRDRREDTVRQRRGHATMEAERSDVSTSQGTPRAATRSWEKSLELTLQKELTLPTAGFQTSGLPNCKRINSWYVLVFFNSYPKICFY